MSFDFEKEIQEIWLDNYNQTKKIVHEKYLNYPPVPLPRVEKIHPVWLEKLKKHNVDIHEQMKSGWGKEELYNDIILAKFVCVRAMHKEKWELMHKHILEKNPQDLIRDRNMKEFVLKASRDALIQYLDTTSKHMFQNYFENLIFETDGMALYDGKCAHELEEKMDAYKIQVAGMCRRFKQYLK